MLGRDYSAVSIGDLNQYRLCAAVRELSRGLLNLADLRDILISDNLFADTAYRLNMSFFGKGGLIYFIHFLMRGRDDPAILLDLFFALAVSKEFTALVACPVFTVSVFSTCFFLCGRVFQRVTRCRNDDLFLTELIVTFLVLKKLFASRTLVVFDVSVCCTCFGLGIHMFHSVTECRDDPAVFSDLCISKSITIELSGCLTLPVRFVSGLSTGRGFCRNQFDILDC